MADKDTTFAPLVNICVSWGCPRLFDAVGIVFDSAGDMPKGSRAKLLTGLAILLDCLDSFPETDELLLFEVPLLRYDQAITAAYWLGVRDARRSSVDPIPFVMPTEEARVD